MTDTKITDFFRNTDALTYVNALKVSLTEIKEELSNIEEMQEYQNSAIERCRSVMRRIDNQYRAITRVAQYDPTEAAENLKITAEEVKPSEDVMDVVEVEEIPEDI